VTDLADRPDRHLEAEVTQGHPGLEHPQDEVGGPHLEQVGGLAHVGVADDDVQPSILLGVGVGLVAGVDDGPRPGRRRRHALPDVVGPLAEGIGRALAGVNDLACATDELA
jgi:hypothetical protein